MRIFNSQKIKTIVDIDDTFSEVFELYYSEILVTAATKDLAMEIARSATGYATSIIGCDCEAGVDYSTDGPDRRPGVVLAFFAVDKKNLQNAILSRLGQNVLTAPTARAFAVSGGDTYDLGKKLSFFGDGYEEETDKFGRRMWSIPLMGGDFLVEAEVGISRGVSGNFQIISADEFPDVALGAVEAIRDVKGAITPFPLGICASGSKLGSKYSFLRASTDNKKCPSIKGNKLPKGAKSVYEIVIDAVDLETLKGAMKAGVEKCDDPSTILITAGNFGGKLGKDRIYLMELMEK
jgi:formylmethanofuran--tetrahydromethanopterin N-formyltransferase